jgi:hypothetical protein
MHQTIAKLKPWRTNLGFMCQYLNKVFFLLNFVICRLIPF